MTATLADLIRDVVDGTSPQPSKMAAIENKLVTERKDALTAALNGEAPTGHPELYRLISLYVFYFVLGASSPLPQR